MRTAVLISLLTFVVSVRAEGAETRYRDSLCGPRAVYHVLRINGIDDVSQLELIEEFDAHGSARQASVHDLCESLRRHGLFCGPIKDISVNDCLSANSCIIMHLSNQSAGDDDRHFVVMNPTLSNHNAVLTVDGLKGESMIPIAALEAKFTGNAIVVATTQSRLDADLHSIKMSIMGRVLLKAILSVTVISASLLLIKRGFLSSKTKQIKDQQ